VRESDRFTNRIGMVMVRVPAGTFLMGSPETETRRNPEESPQHQVTISRPFSMDANKVTVGQFRAFVRATQYRTDAEKNGQGSVRFDSEKDRILPEERGQLDPQCTWQNPGWQQQDDFPVVCVSWDDARAFCTWLSKEEGRTYRLPTEAEWEYACRAGTTTPFAFGASLSSFQANFYGHVPYGDAAPGPYLKHPTRVGSYKQANGFGIYDMHGNVAEWTADYYGLYQGGSQTDPTGPIKNEDKRRTIRGGSWRDPAQLCRSAMRGGAPYYYTCNCIGFRVICAP
jgi:formylglycine-generating enzyme required for sulfatase activity